MWKYSFFFQMKIYHINQKRRANHQMLFNTNTRGLAENTHSQRERDVFKKITLPSE